MYTLLATVQLEVVAQTLAVRQRQLEVVDTDTVSAAVRVRTRENCACLDCALANLRL